MGVEAFGAEAAIEGFDKHIIGWLAGLEKSIVTPR